MTFEHIEPLGNNIKILVSDIHRFNTDTILLANFASPKKYETAIDLGTGCGTIPLIWNRNNPPKHTYAVDIQSDACDLLNRSLKLNSLENKISVLNCDIRELDKYKLKGQFDVVSCNPPYKVIGTGITNSSLGKTIARHEQDITLENICEMAKKLLRFGGRFCLCQRTERLTDVLECFRKYDLEPKRLRFVQQRPSKPSKFFMIEGKSGSNKGGLITLPTLFIEGNNGDFSDEMKEIYGDYKSYKYQ